MFLNRITWHYTQVIGCFIILGLLFSPCFSQNKMKSPNKKSNQDFSEEYGTGNNLILNFYQKWLSPVKGGNKCPMHPSCSQYAKISFKILPWYKAYPKSMERLLRCGAELYLYPTIQINGSIKWYDPVVNKAEINENKNSIFDH